MTKRVLSTALIAGVALGMFAIISGGCAAQGLPSDTAVYTTGPTPATIVQMSKGGGVIDIGQAFSTVLAPYINAAVNALILAGVGWLGTWMRSKYKIDIDEKHRDALTAFLQNQAGALLSAGAVKMDGIKVNVDSGMLALAANQAISRIPDAAKHFGLTPDVVAKKIVEAIPQIAAGAQIIAQSHAAAPSGLAQLP